MGKSKKGSWGDPYDFEDTQPKGKPTVEWDEEDEDAQQYIQDALEALSHLYNKTHKRGRPYRAAKKSRGWQ